MSDFLTGLREEVLEAHAAHRRRGVGRRTGRRLAAGAPRILAAATAACALVVAVLAIRALAPAPSGAPQVLEVIRLGGNPTDAVFAEGSVWIGDFAGRRVVRIDPSSRRVTARVAARGQPVAVAAGGGGTWVRTAVGDGGAVARVGSDERTRVGYGSTLAVGSAAVWAADVEIGPERLHRIDPDTGRDVAPLDMAAVYALAVGGDDLWAVTANGTVMRLDSRTGKVRARWPAVAISSGTANPALVADADGAWVLRVGQGSDSRAIRLEGDRVVRRLPIRPTVRPILAQAADGLWVVDEEPVRHRYAAVRLDPLDGRVTGRIELGSRNPTALLPVGERLWITASDGSVTVVGDE